MQLSNFLVFIVLKYEEYQNVEENRAITIRIQKSKNYILLFKKGSKARDNAYQIPRNRIEKTFDELADDFMKESIHYTKRRTVKSSQMESFIATNMEIFEDNKNCPFCNNTLKEVVIHNSDDDMDSRMCTVCKRRFVNKRQYKVIRKYCGANNIIPELYIMDFHEDKGRCKAEFRETDGQTISKVLDRNKFYVIGDESDVCPIHNCKMKIKVIDFGAKQKDTVYFCAVCNKYIISRKHCDYLKNQCNKGGKCIMYNAEFVELM